jgi:hypothetical protein
MFRITIRAGGISLQAGPMAAKDIEQEFRENRPWHTQVSCSYTDGTLTLIAINDFDDDGLALSDEFSDCLSAFIALGERSDEGNFEVAKVEVL